VFQFALQLSEQSIKKQMSNDVPTTGPIAFSTFRDAFSTSTPLHASQLFRGGGAYVPDTDANSNVPNDTLQNGVQKTWKISNFRGASASRLLVNLSAEDVKVPFGETTSNWGMLLAQGTGSARPILAGPGMGSNASYVEFRGVDQVMFNSANMTMNSSNGGGVTLLFGMSINSNATESNRIVSLGNGQINAFVEGSNVNFENTATGQRVRTTSNVMPRESWRTIGLRYIRANATPSIWIDGVSQPLSTVNAGTGAVWQTLQMNTGACVLSGSGASNGSLQARYKRMRLYDQALPDAQMAVLSNLHAPFALYKTNPTYEAIFAQKQRFKFDLNDSRCYNNSGSNFVNLANSSNINIQAFAASNVVTLPNGVKTYQTNYSWWDTGVLVDHATKDFAYECWVYDDVASDNTSAGTSGALISNRVVNNYANTSYFLLPTTSGSLLFGNTGNGSNVQSSTVSIVDSKWHHVVMAGTGSVLKLWLDKSPVGEVQRIATTDNNTTITIRVGLSFDNRRTNIRLGPIRIFHDYTMDQTAVDAAFSSYANYFPSVYTQSSSYETIFAQKQRFKFDINDPLCYNSSGSNFNNLANNSNVSIQAFAASNVVTLPNGIKTYQTNFSWWDTGVLVDHATKDFAYECWVYDDNTSDNTTSGTNGPVITNRIVNDGSITSYHLMIRTGAGELLFGNMGNGGTLERTTSTIVGNSCWHHVVMAGVGTVLKIWIDKVPVAEMGRIATTDNNTNSIRVGNAFENRRTNVRFGPIRILHDYTMDQASVDAAFDSFATTYFAY
jgi:hypothetical protein